MSRTDAVESMYQDMAARHRSRFRSIHVRLHQQFVRLGMHTHNTTDPEGC